MSVTVTGQKRHLDLNSSTLTTTGNITAGGNIILGDGQYIHLGDNPDLKIYHNGSHSFIQDTGAGDLRLLGSSIKLQSTTEENMLVATPDAGVTLYYNNSAKFETYDAGVGVTGNAYLTSGNHVHFDNGVSNNYYIRKTSTKLEFKTGGSYDFLSGNVFFAGDVTANKLKMGNTQLYPSGDNNHIHFIGTALIGTSTTASSNPSIGTSTYPFNTMHAGHFYGDGSNLTGITASNADTVDNLHASSFIRSDAADTASSVISFTSGIKTPSITTINTNQSLFLYANGSGHIYFGDSGNGNNLYHYSTGNDGVYTTYDWSSNYYRIGTSATSGVWIDDNLRISALDANGNADISGTLVSGAHTINTGTDGILTLNQTGTDNKWSYINFNNQGTREWFIGQDSSGNFDLYNDNINAYAITVGYTNNAIGLNGNTSVTGNLSATGTVTGSNLSGTNTGDQDLSGYVTLAGAQTITGNKTFSVQPTFNADTLHNGHIYGRAVNNSFSHLYRFGGLFLTWDSDSYGTNLNHSITSTDNGTYSDSITINSFDKVRINIDSNNNDSASTFTIGKHTTGTANTLLTLEEDGDLTITGSLTWSGGSSANANTAYGWGNHASAGYLTSSGTIAQANNLQAFDDRDMAPEDLSYSDDLKLFFSAKEGLEDGTSTGSDWHDVLVLNSYSDSSGGNANVLAFDKNSYKIRHYQAGLSASNWGTAKELAYTASPALTGNPTAPTQSAGNNSTRIATTAFVTTAVSNLVDTAPDALNTLNELAAALGDDANFSTTVTNSIATKLPLAGGTLTGSLTIGDGTADTRLAIKRVDGANADDIQFFNGTTRVGEIGTKDTTWLRINEHTAKNIYTPRYIRADGGLFVDGTSKGINGSGNFIGGTIAGASDYGTLLRSDAADTATGKITLEGNSADWNTTTPGTTTGSLHFDPGVTTDHFGNAITFGASDTSNGTTAQAGIYLRTDGNYGSRMYFATTDNYSQGSKVAMYINQNKDVYFLDDINVAGNIVVSGTVDGVDIANHNHDNRYYTETESDAKFTSTDASGDNYTFELEDESNFSGNKWYHVATIDSANGGLHIRGAMLNHVENFASQKIDIAIQVREENDGGQLEITGSLDVLHNATSGTDKCGIRVIKSSEDGTYDEFKVYVRVTRYQMVTLRLTQQGSVVFNTNHSSPLTSEPAAVSGGHVELDTSSTPEGNYVIDNSTIKEIYHEGHKPTYAELGTMAYSNLTDTPTIPSGNQIIDWSAENAGTIHSSNYTNTTYSVGDGGLTQNNLTNALKSNYDTAYTYSQVGHLPLTGGTLSGVTRFDGGVTIDTATNTNTLNVSRSGSTSSQVMKIGVTDTVAEFNYIEDTSAEGNGNFGQYIFKLGGNDGETTVSALNITKTGISAPNLNVTNWDTAYTHSQVAHAPSNAEANVNADWNSSSGDSEILNKPTIPSGNQIIDWTADHASEEIHSGNIIGVGSVLSLPSPANGIEIDSGNSNASASCVPLRLFQNGTSSESIKFVIDSSDSSNAKNRIISDSDDDNAQFAISLANASGTEEEGLVVSRGVGVGLGVLNEIGSDTNKFLMVDDQNGNVIEFVTGPNLRSYIGAGTSSFSGAYADLTGKPTLLEIGTTSTTALAGNTTTISSAQSQKLGYITVTQAVNLDTIESNAATAAGWGNHASAGYLTSFDITTQTDSKYIRSDADDTVSAHTEWQDSKQARFGNDSDLYIQHTGSEGQIFNSTGQLDIRSSTRILLTSSAGENMAKFHNDGAVELYYNNSQKFATTSSGVSVTGTVQASGNIGNKGTNIGQVLEYGTSSVATLRFDSDRWRIYSGGSGGAGERFSVLETGNVGVGDSTPSYKLDVAGTIRATGDVIAYSDERVKENIKTIDNSLEKVNKLRGVEFNKIGEDKKSIGVIAQEVEKILPEVVRTDDEGMKSVAYGNVVGVLIEAVKELTKEVEELKKCNKCKNCNCNA